MKFAKIMTQQFSVEGLGLDLSRITGKCVFFFGRVVPSLDALQQALNLASFTWAQPELMDLIDASARLGIVARRRIHGYDSSFEGLMREPASFDVLEGIIKQNCHCPTINKVYPEA